MSRRFDDRVGFVTRGIFPVRVRVVIQQVVRDRVDHGARRLRSARGVEISNRASVVFALKRGKPRANFLRRGNLI